MISFRSLNSMATDFYSTTTSNIFAATTAKTNTTTTTPSTTSSTLATSAASTLTLLWGKNLWAVLLVPLCVVVVFGNVLVILSVAKERALRSYNKYSTKQILNLLLNKTYKRP